LPYSNFENKEFKYDDFNLFFNFELNNTLVNGVEFSNSTQNDINQFVAELNNMSFETKISYENFVNLNYDTNYAIMCNG
jgi:hypothetical protein